MYCKYRQAIDKDKSFTNLGLVVYVPIDKKEPRCQRSCYLKKANQDLCLRTKRRLDLICPVFDFDLHFFELWSLQYKTPKNGKATQACVLFLVYCNANRRAD